MFELFTLEGYETKRKKSEYSQKDANGKGMTSDCVTSAQIILNSEKLLENERKIFFSLSELFI
jgi:hypothetical protein